MSALRSILVFVITSAVASTAMGQDGRSRAELRRQEIDTNAQQTLERLFAQKGNATELYEQAAGYSVFSATKAGFILTGGRGTGVAVDKASGARFYMRMATGGVSLGIGAQKYDLIVLFEQREQLERFINGSWDASTSAQAAAGKDGLTFMSSFADGIAMFQITDRGLMAQADVSGTRFWLIDDLNSASARQSSVVASSP